MNASIKDNFTYQYKGNDSRRLLEKLSESWSKRAQVRHCEVHTKKYFDESKPDFINELLPFYQLDAYKSLPQEYKDKLLTAGWLIYNSKTIDIEKEIVIPLCNKIIDGKPIGIDSVEARRNASETMVDEAYHVLLCVTANDITKYYRDVPVNLCKANVVRRMDEAINECDKQWQIDVISLITAFVSETIISDYLSLLSKDKTIQPLHREVVFAHQLDEGVHGYAFAALLKSYFKAVSVEQRQYAISTIPKAIEWFQTPSFDAWFQLIEYFDIPGFSCENEELRNCILQHKEPVNGEKVMDKIPYLAVKPIFEYSI